jgi:hypothetical protein
MDEYSDGQMMEDDGGKSECSKLTPIIINTKWLKIPFSFNIYYDLMLTKHPMCEYRFSISRYEWYARLHR